MDADTDTWALLVSPLAAILHQCEMARGQRKMDTRLEEVEKHAVRMRDLLARHDGNITRSAQEAGLTRYHLRELLKRHGISARPSDDEL